MKDDYYMMAQVFYTISRQVFAFNPVHYSPKNNGLEPG